MERMSFESYFRCNIFEHLREDERIEGGEIVCKRCGTRRSAYIEDAGRHFRVLCACQQEAEKREAEEKGLRERQEYMKRLFDHSLLGRRYENVSFSNTDLTGASESFKAAFKRCKKYCELWREVKSNGYGIYLYGVCGTGKTHLAACIVKALVAEIQPVLFTSFIEISKALREGYSGKSKATEDRYLASVADIDFLIIDDFGTEVLYKLDRNGNREADTWMQEKVYDVLNLRYNNQKATIFTSNYSINQLIKERGLSEKTADRISAMSSAIMKIEGASYRKRREKPLF